MRTTHLLALVPASFVVLAISMWLLPPSFITPFMTWLLIEIGLGVAFVISYFLSHKFGLARDVPVIFAGLIITLMLVFSYVTIDVQRLAFAITAIASCGLYYRIVVEFNRRKYA